MTADADAHPTEDQLRGQRVVRREDPALVTGHAEYTDDLRKPGMLHAAIVRSQYAHAEIEAIDTAAAEAVDGVVAVFTGDDVDPETVGGVPTFGGPPSFGGMRVTGGPNVPERPLLATERVRYTGEALAVVLAERRYAAHEAAEAVEVEYDRLDAVVDATEAHSIDAPQVHDDAPENLSFVWEVGDAEATDDAFESAPNTVSIDLTNQRLAPNSMEPRGALADWDAIEGTLEVHVSTQAPHDHRGLFSNVLSIPEQKVHVVGPAVGGGFGLKNKYFAGELLAAWASTQIGRPVKWMATRTEAFRTDTHGRDHATTCELAFEDDGTLLSLRADTTVNVGAYLSKVGAYISTRNYGPLLSGQYAIPAIHCSVTGVFTNTAPTDAYRGAGRPEACYVVERLMDRAAVELGMDPAELRQMNYLQPDEFPYETPVESVYDSGDYEPALDLALEHANYDEMRERQEQLREEGRYLGIGIGGLVESAGGGPESGLVRFHPSGTVTAYVGTFDHGQGHHTTFAQVLADELGVPFEDVEVVDGDTERVPKGTGTFGSRSTIAGGNVLRESARKVVESARPVAAHHLETSTDDVEFEDGTFHVVGAPDRGIHIQEVARKVYAGEIPEGVEAGLEATTFLDTEQTFPFGTHVAVVEVDVDSGEVDLQQYVAVDDCGPQLNPIIVEGQVHGGVAQGLGQARLEHAVYDENGTLVTGSFQDYAMPRAEHVPDMVTDHTVTPSPRNALGVKGTGEAGTIAAPPAYVNAVVDALSPLGVESLDMPLTDEAVWRAVQDATAD